MNIPDLINSAFETTGGFVCFLNIRRLLKDRKVEGVDWRVSAFFSAWGFWNLFYYPHLGQWFSFLGGIGLVLTNTTWVALAIGTIRRQKRFTGEGNFPMNPPQPPLGTDIWKLPEIKHTYKCECDLCVERGNVS